MHDNYSLKKRLLYSIGFPVVVAGLLVALLAFSFAWHEVDEVYDDQMGNMARVLIDLSREKLEQGSIEKIRPDLHGLLKPQDYQRKIGYRLWYKEELVVESFKARDFGDLNLPEGFTNLRIKNKPWRFYEFHEGDFHVEIAERYAIRYELIGQLVISLVIPALLFIPVMLFMVWAGTRKALKPLVLLSRAVDDRRMDDLSAVETRNIPLEVLPLMQAMNRLFVRISESFKKEREFTDHAAHELRTPLAAMKTQTQVLMKKASLSPDYKDGLNNLNLTIDRATHMVEQLLSLARLQSEKFPMEMINLSELLFEAADEIAAKAKAKNQLLTIATADHLMIKGHSDSLVILLRNLLDNAVKYTPPRGSIALSLDADGKMTIADTGAGISDTDKIHAFARFIRFDKTGQTGTGLGLSIAQWITQAHGVTLTLEDNKPSGLVVKIKWNVASGGG